LNAGRWERSIGRAGPKPGGIVRKVPFNDPPGAVFFKARVTAPAGDAASTVPDGGYLISV
jgi:hypothetical protein